MSQFTDPMISKLPGVAYRLLKKDKWRLEEISDKVFDLTGYGADEFLSRKITFFEITHRDDSHYVREEVQKSLLNDGQFSIEYRIVAKDGSVKYLWERGQGIFDGNGNIQEVVGFVFDSSSQQRKNERIKHYQKLIVELARSENLGRGYVELFARECARSAPAIMEVERASVWFFSNEEGKLFQECCYDSPSDSFQAGWDVKVDEYPLYFNELSSGRPMNVENAFTDSRTSQEHASGYYYENNIRSFISVAIRRGEKMLGVVSLEQMHKIRRWGVDEIALTNELADLLSQALSNRELRQAEKKLLESQAANDAKKIFLGIMSHELRTPLNGVVGVAELLNMTELDRQQRDYVENIEHSGNQLLQIISAVIDLSNLQERSLSLELRPLDLKDLLEETCRTLKAEANDKLLDLNLWVSESLPSFLIADGHRLQQIIYGLIRNGIKYTEFGAVTVSAEFNHTASRSQLILTVKDTGKGIPKDIQDNIFSPFVQERELSSGASLRGVGLNLAISYELAKLMEGKLYFSTTEGKGTCFTLELPVVIAEHQEDTRKININDAIKKLKTLIVEDNSVNQKVALGLLKKFGIEAEVCSDGEQAVEKVRRSKTPYDLILMDCEMPVMDGFDATQIIRRMSGGHGETYIAAVTAHAVSEYREKAERAGMNEFLTKPLSKKSLEKLLVSLVSPQ